jgi:TRAP-type C4-dicarboxylate transport system permease small subunit
MDTIMSQAKRKPAWIKACEAAMAAMLALMVVMVFGNVVLRYGFNSGIVTSEEAARFLFVWLTFVGAVVAMYEGTHLGVDSLVRMVNSTAKKWMFGVSSSLMLGCCVLLFIGSYKQTMINLTVPSAVMEIPMALMYGIGMVAAGGMGFILAMNLFKLLTGRLIGEDLIQSTESEELIEQHVTSEQVDLSALITGANSATKNNQSSARSKSAP